MRGNLGGGNIKGQAWVVVGDVGGGGGVKHGETTRHSLAAASVWPVSRRLCITFSSCHMNWGGISDEWLDCMIDLWLRVIGLHLHGQGNLLSS